MNILPTPQELRQIYIDKGIKPKQNHYGVFVSDPTFIPRSKGCCALGAIVAYLDNPLRLTPALFLQDKGYNTDSILEVLRDFDSGGEYWKAVEDLA